MSPILNPAHGRSRPIRRAALVTLAFAAALAVWGSLAAEGGRSTSKRATFVTPTIGSVIVNGAVAKPMTLSLANLEALPQRTMPVTFLSGTNPVANTETGPLLADVLALAQPKFHKTCPNDRLRFYVVVTASDGYASILSWGEIDPGLGNRQPIVSLVENGVVQTGGPRVLQTGDVRGGRAVSGTVALTVVRAPTQVPLAGC